MLGHDSEMTCTIFNENLFRIEREINEKHALQIYPNNCVLDYRPTYNEQSDLDYHCTVTVRDSYCLSVSRIEHQSRSIIGLLEARTFPLLQLKARIDSIGGLNAM